MVGWVGSFLHDKSRDITVFSLNFYFALESLGILIFLTKKIISRIYFLRYILTKKYLFLSVVDYNFDKFN